MSLSPEQHALAETLRVALEHGTDEQLDDFLSSYWLGAAAGFLLAHMTPEQRVAFVADLRRRYPEAFAQGVA